MGSHIVGGLFQSDKYPTCPPGKVPLSVNDATAQDLLWEYAQRRRVVDAEFADDLEYALRHAGYKPPEVKRDPHEWGVFDTWQGRWCPRAWTSYATALTASREYNKREEPGSHRYQAQRRPESE